MTTAGRPTAYRREFCELAHNYCLLGATNPELAGFFDVAPRTIDNWIASHPAFAEAVREGRVVADARVARCLYERAVGYSCTVERTVLHERRGADAQERRALSARHAGLHLLAAQPPARGLVREERGRAGRRRPAVRTTCWPSSMPRASARGKRRWRSAPSSGAALTFWPTPPSAQAARFFRASPMPSQLEPMKIRSMPRKMPSV